MSRGIEFDILDSWENCNYIGHGDIEFYDAILKEELSKTLTKGQKVDVIVFNFSESKLRIYDYESNLLER